jgi:membrane protease YdiL (CAAX protease family)
MGDNSGRNRMWRVLTPLLFYWGINMMLAPFIASSFIITRNRISELQRAMDGQVITLDSLDYILNQIRAGEPQELTPYIVPYMPYIIVFGAAMTLIYSIIAFSRDRKDEVEKGLLVKIAPKIWQYSLIVGLAIAACIGMNFILLMMQVAFPDLRYAQIASDAIFSAPFIFQIMGFGIITSVAEEFLFRGLIFKRYRENGGFVRSMIMSSMVFAIVHSNLVQFIYAFVLGALCAYVYEKFGTLKAPIVLHIVANVTSLLLTQVDGFRWFFEVPIRVGIAIVLAAFIGSSLIVLLRSAQFSSEVIESKENH